MKMGKHVTNPNDPAFPDNFVSGKAMTKREFYSAVAMHAIISENYLNNPDWISEHAVKNADAIIKKLNETKE